MLIKKKKHKLSDAKTRVGLQIFDDKEYLKQRGDSRLSKASSSKASSEGRASITQVSFILVCDFSTSPAAKSDSKKKTKKNWKV
jgi:hypothetical protein